MRSNSGKPTWDANSLICVDTAGCDRCSSSAAREKFMWRAAVANTRSCRRVTLRIATSGVSPPKYYEILMLAIEIFNFYSGSPGRRVSAGEERRECGNGSCERSGEDERGAGRGARGLQPRFFRAGAPLAVGRADTPPSPHRRTRPGLRRRLRGAQSAAPPAGLREGVPERPRELDPRALPPGSLKPRLSRAQPRPGAVPRVS